MVPFNLREGGRIDGARIQTMIAAIDMAPIIRCLTPILPDSSTSRFEVRRFGGGVNADMICFGPLMRLHMRFWLLAFTITLASCATTPPGAKQSDELIIALDTWWAYEHYAAQVPPSGTAAFAVSVDGNHSFAVLCGSVTCEGEEVYRQAALDQCRSFGLQCLIFAYGKDILVKYRIE